MVPGSVRNWIAVNAVQLTRNKHETVELKQPSPEVAINGLAMNPATPIETATMALQAGTGYTVSKKAKQDSVKINNK
jgi:hypothetical protein